MNLRELREEINKPENNDFLELVVGNDQGKEINFVEAIIYTDENGYDINQSSILLAHSEIIDLDETKLTAESTDLSNLSYEEVKEKAEAYPYLPIYKAELERRTKHK